MLNCEIGSNYVIVNMVYTDQLDGTGLAPNNLFLRVINMKMHKKILDFKLRNKLT